MSGNLCYSFGPFELDGGLRELRVAGVPTRLTPKDVDVLLVLVARRGELVPKEALFGAVWGTVVVEDCNLARHVANLRRVLGDDPDHPTFIETIPRRGYRFVAPVEVVSAAAPSVTVQVTPAAVADALVEPVQAPQEGRGRLRQVGRGAVVLCVLALLPAFSWLAGRGRPAGAMRALAVLPVANLTGDPRHDHLAETLGEMTVNDLGRLRRQGDEHLRVLPRSATAAYRAAPVTSSQAAATLGVDGLLEAALVQADGRLRVSAVLVDARSGAVAWAHELEGAPEELMALQDDLVFALAGHLGLHVGPGELPLASRSGPGGAPVASPPAAAQAVYH